MASVAEIAPGVQYQFSGEQGQTAAQVTRVFRILKASPSEYINVAALCGVFVGDEHPQEAGLYCVSFQAQYEGDSRMVIQATFTYKTTPYSVITGFVSVGDRNASAPELRPPAVSFTTSLQEAPVYGWEKLTGLNQGLSYPVNAAGDTYDTLARLVPVTTITIKIFSLVPLLDVTNQVGGINDSEVRISSTISYEKHTLMFRAIQSTPTIEEFSNQRFSGWEVSFEFLYNPNKVNVRFANGTTTAEDPQPDRFIGWDIIVPQSGINCLAHQPANPLSKNNNSRNDFALPLRTVDNRVDLNAPALAQGVAVGQKVRSNVIVAETQSGGIVCRPASLPIPLNEDGTPRGESLNPGVLVNRYRIYPEIDFSQVFPRLF